MLRPSFLSLALSVAVLAISARASAQPTCSLPVSGYLTDAAGTALDGTIDIDLEFYLEADPEAAPSECRSFASVAVNSGWVRLDVDACAPPAAGDCGATALSEILRGADGLWVAFVADGEELGPRVPIGAVPYAVEAGNAAALEGLGADAFEAAGTVDTHAVDPDAHHSSTSDGIVITPASVEVGDTVIESGSVDLGPDAADALTAEIVQTLTGGGEADALHGHSGGGGGGGCYVAVGISTCAAAYSPAYTGIYGHQVTFADNGVAASPFCMADAAVGSLVLLGPSSTDNRFITGYGGTDQWVEPVDDAVVCALCCP